MASAVTDHRASIAPQNWASAEDNTRAEKILACGEAFEQGIAVDFWESCNKYYRLYRGFQRFQGDWRAAGENDRDGVLYEAKNTWGAQLHIPLSFRTIETMVPRAIAHRPRMLYLPRDERWEENVQNVRLLIDAQQEQIDVELEYQDVMRSGMIYGLGIGKSFWRKEYAARRRVKPRLFLPGKFYVGGPQRELAFDDPDFENVDVFDFFWDPYASSIRTCRWVIQRCWLSLESCLERVQSGAWNTESAKALDEDRLRQLNNGGTNRYDDIWQQRNEASGLGHLNRAPRGEHVHEVWEWHDGEQVNTLLDRQLFVQDAENPCFGHIPFHAYRPTKLPNQMIGIGEIEPTQHLQRELDTLRSQRRDAATMALMAGYAYDSGAIDEEDLQFGPSAAIRVTNARPADALMPLQVRDVPGSGYQEEQVIRQDFDAVTGVADGLGDQNGGPAGTATEAQLVQAALSKRIELKSRRFEVEVVRASARCFLLLNQRMILKGRAPIRQPADGMSMQESAEVGRWQWFPIGPGELRGEFEIIPEGGSMAAENTPQKRQDAVQILQLFGGNPYIDERRPILKALQLFDVRDPESWLKQANPTVPEGVLDVLKSMGVDPSAIQTAIRVAQQRDPRLQGPDASQVDQMMGGGQEQADQQPVAA